MLFDHKISPFELINALAFLLINNLHLYTYIYQIRFFTAARQSLLYHGLTSARYFSVFYTLLYIGSLLRPVSIEQHFH